MEPDINDHAADDDDDLDPEAELVAQRLAEGASHAEAALSIGRSSKWVQRRLGSDPAFKQRVRDLKQERVSRASARLGTLLDQVFDMAERNLSADRPADQIAAGRLIIDRERTYSNAADMADTVDDLKQEIADLRSLITDMKTHQNGEAR
jgi:hypothetical protein